METPERRDLNMIVTSFPGDIQKSMIIDVSVGSTHAASNVRHTINADKYSSGLPDHGAFLKDQKHAHYIHDGNAIGFTLDSMGGISNAALNFTKLLYAKGSGIRRRRWDLDCMRIALKKKNVGSLSSVLCHHRVLDFIFLGLPNRRLEQLQVAQAPPIPAAMLMGVV